MAEIEFITQYDSRSPISEAYRTIRTNLQFAGAGQTLKIVGLFQKKESQRLLQIWQLSWDRIIKKSSSSTAT